MAWGLIYFANIHQSIKQLTDEYRINIYKEDYVGPSSEMELKDSPFIVKQNSVDTFDAIKQTTVTLKIYTITEGQYDEFLTAAYADYKMEVIINPDVSTRIVYTLYNQSEIGKESYIHPPYILSTKWTCGLSHLKFVRFEDSDNNLEETAKNTNNTSTVSASIPIIYSISAVRIKISAVTGTHDNHIVTLQTSPDDIIWSNSSHAITGATSLLADNLSTNYVRLKVTTAEGSASTVKWTIRPTFTGQRSLLEVLRLCLNKLKAPLNIYESVNVYEADQLKTVNDSMLTQTYVDSSLYQVEKELAGDKIKVGMFCHDVIKAVLESFLAHIYQWDGVWYIIRIEEYKGANIDRRIYLPSVGSEDSDSLFNYTSLAIENIITGNDKGNPLELAIIGNTTSETMEPINRTRLTFKSNTLDFIAYNVLPHGRFKSIDYNGVTDIGVNYSGSPSYWEEGPGLNTNTYAAFYPKPPWGWLTGISHYGSDLEKVFAFDNLESLNNTTHTSPNFNPVGSELDTDIYLEYTKTNVPITTGDSFRLEFYNELNCVGLDLGLLWVRNSLIIHFPFYIKFGIHYLTGNNIDGYSWGTTETWCTYTRTGVGNIDTKAEIVSPGLFFFSVRAFFVINQDLPTMPSTGLKDLIFRFGKPHTNSNYQIESGFHINMFEMGYFGMFHNASVTTTVEDIVIYSEIDEDENVYKKTFLHADGLSFLSQNAFRLDTLELTGSWERRGITEDFKILEIMSKSLAEIRGQFIRQLSIRLVGKIELYETLVYTVGVTTTTYMITSVKSFDAQTGTYNLVILEVSHTFVKSHILGTIITPVRDLGGYVGSGGGISIPLTNDHTTHDHAPSEKTNTTEITLKQGVYIRNLDEDISKFK